MKEYNIAWCPLCDQGWVKIVKEISSNKLHLCCSECETQWLNPSEILEDTCLPFNSFGTYTNPTISEIKENNWEKYLT